MAARDGRSVQSTATRAPGRSKRYRLPVAPPMTVMPLRPTYSKKTCACRRMGTCSGVRGGSVGGLLLGIDPPIAAPRLPQQVISALLILDIERWRVSGAVGRAFQEDRRARQRRPHQGALQQGF